MSSRRACARVCLWTMRWRRPEMPCVLQRERRVCSARGASVVQDDDSSFPNLGVGPIAHGTDKLQLNSTARASWQPRVV